MQKKIRQNPFISLLLKKPWNCLSHRPTLHWPKYFLSRSIFQTWKPARLQKNKQLEKVAKSKIQRVGTFALLLKWCNFGSTNWARKWPDFLIDVKNSEKSQFFWGLLEIRQSFLRPLFSQEKYPFHALDEVHKHLRWKRGSYIHFLPYFSTVG